MRVLALLDGTIVDPEAPLFRADDLGVMRGDGIFETVLVADRQPRELGPHLDRLERSARLMQMQLPERAAWERALQAVIDNWPWDTDPEMALKLVCTRGLDEGDGTPHGFAMGMQIGEDTRRKRRDGVAAVTLERGFAPDLMDRAPWLLLSAKTLSYAVNMAALREAQSRGAEEVIFTATDDSVLEGPTSTVVIARGRTLVTTPPSSGILKGTTQGALFRAAEQAGWRTEVAAFPTSALFEADGVWMCSSVRLVTQVHTIDGTAIKADPELHAEISRLYESNY
ncbi:4-amino-4-deoxychorismate lyase [Saccharopolyspora antimicrobica]|uniref:4-amino-4-deoxychorismate lyase n=1 Tax=Saccharopolyspora antimicrobica TaxID=455193 RepID=A0A1I5JPC5_9PSEU|nr:aminodeoxychorismate lyase [Saccharopolyspora antimicrobica]RKT84725.1 4-amino-4-deoxychorismate lyase [Saccharopolyspora antimicrobica]SFO74674.1 4-amino-4-deoxychorismate lyase [Saccharopolyspora antimicrobica]